MAEKNYSGKPRGSSDDAYRPASQVARLLLQYGGFSGVSDMFRRDGTDDPLTRMIETGGGRVVGYTAVLYGDSAVVDPSLREELGAGNATVVKLDDITVGHTAPARDMSVGRALKEISRRLKRP